MPKEFQIPATGAVEYQYIKIKGNFPEDVWVEAAETQSGNSKVVHHAKPGRFLLVEVDGQRGRMASRIRCPRCRKFPQDDADVIGKFNPGVGPQYLQDRGFGEMFISAARTSSLRFTTPPMASPRPTGPRPGSCTQKVFTPRATSCRMRPGASNLVIPAGDNAGSGGRSLAVVEPMRPAHAQPHHASARQGLTSFRS